MSIRNRLLLTQKKTNFILRCIQTVQIQTSLRLYDRHNKWSTKIVEKIKWKKFIRLSDKQKQQLRRLKNIILYKFSM